MRLSDLTKGDDGRLIIAVNGGGLKQFTGDKLEPFPIRAPSIRIRCSGTEMLIRISCSATAMEVSGSEPWQRGLIHVHHGRADVFTKVDGLSGNIVAGLFEDHEGNIWVSTTGGIDRFRELPPLLSLRNKVCPAMQLIP